MDGASTAANDAGTKGGLPETGAAPCDASGPCAANGWIRQFGTADEDGVLAVAVDPNDNVYVVGLLGSSSPPDSDGGGGYDAFVRKYDSSGGELWTRRFGTADSDVAESVALDENGNVYVAGAVRGALPGQPYAGASDAFVRKYSPSGDVIWTRELGSSGYDTGYVSVGASGAVYVWGYTEAGLAGQPAPDPDAGRGGSLYLRRVDGSGSEIWTKQFGAGASGASFGQIGGAATVDPSGFVYFAGFTDGTLPGQASLGGEDAFVHKMDASGNAVWTRQFGTTGADAAHAIATDASGNVYVAGRTFGVFEGEASAGGADAFVRKIDPAGDVLWTRQFGTSTADTATAVVVDARGIVHVAGTTSGALPGAASAGSTDAFEREYDGNGSVLRTAQFGSSEIEQDVSMAVGSDGYLYVAGQTNGVLPGQTNPNPGFFDAFVTKRAP